MTDLSSALARFRSKVQTPDDPGECWAWTGTSLGDGYSGFNSGEIAGKSAHRFAYIAFVGPIPEGYDVDHMCRNRACVNPSHLQAVSKALNQQNRKGVSRNSRSGYRNVIWSSRRSKWAVETTVNGRVYKGGFFDDPEEANRAAIALRNQLMTNNIEDRMAS